MQCVGVSIIEPGVGWRVNVSQVIVFGNGPGACIDAVNIDLSPTGDFHIQRMAFLDQAFGREIEADEVAVGMKKLEFSIIEVFFIFGWHRRNQVLGHPRVAFFQLCYGRCVALGKGVCDGKFAAIGKRAKLLDGDALVIGDPMFAVIIIDFVAVHDDIEH
mgnify:CR=1 FL=1